jgi:hypothetical protein
VESWKIFADQPLGGQIQAWLAQSGGCNSTNEPQKALSDPRQISGR